MSLGFLEYDEYLDFFALRISKLRTAKKVSTRDMSLSIGKSKGYITALERKPSLPSMYEFLKICDFIGITPKDFFDEGIENPEALGGLFQKMKLLSQQELTSVTGIVDVMVSKKK